MIKRRGMLGMLDKKNLYKASHSTSETTEQSKNHDFAENWLKSFELAKEQSDKETEEAKKKFFSLKL